MKHYLLAALLCFLLCGCAQQPLSQATPTEEAISAAAYDPNNPQSIPGILDVYPLSLRKVQGMRAMGDDILLFSGHGSTALTLLDGDDLTLRASALLDFQLDQKDPSLRFHKDSLSFFDPLRRETVLLDQSLQPLRQISAPENLTGTPILSADCNTLYYCTASAIRAWDLTSGIRRVIKILPEGDHALTGLHLEDTVLQCRITGEDSSESAFLSADTGLLLTQRNGDAALITAGERYYAALPAGSRELLVFGTSSDAPCLLLPKDHSDSCTFLPDVHSAVTACLQEDDTVQLCCYDLGTGTIRDELTLPAFQLPSAILSGPGTCVYILSYDPAADCALLYCWDISPSSGDGRSYTHPCQTEASPDADSLKACKDYAAALSSKYGIEILVLEEAAAVEPWDYDFEKETQSALLLQELELLDQRLARYPQEVLAATAAHFSALKIALVRQITGSAASGSLDTATGIQFFDETDAYVVLATGKYAEQGLYHELFHVMETHILTESTAFDQWNDLNPAGFEYSYRYDSNRNSGIYLEGEYRSFIDTYSMSFPKEDRARILEYAMLPGQEALFSHPILQNKLSALCRGIRDAYRLDRSPEIFPWEQYLEDSLAWKE